MSVSASASSSATSPFGPSRDTCGTLGPQPRNPKGGPRTVDPCPPVHRPARSGLGLRVRAKTCESHHESSHSATPSSSTSPIYDRLRLCVLGCLTLPTGAVCHRRCPETPTRRLKPHRERLRNAAAKVTVHALPRGLGDTPCMLQPACLAARIGNQFVTPCELEPQTEVDPLATAQPKPNRGTLSFVDPCPSRMLACCRLGNASRQSQLGCPDSTSLALHSRLELQRSAQFHLSLGAG